MKVFLMLVYCAVSASPATHCEVKWSRATYPSVQMCSYVASSWLADSRQFDKRKPTGVFCEIAKTAPKPYLVDARDFR